MQNSNALHLCLHKTAVDRKHGNEACKSVCQSVDRVIYRWILQACHRQCPHFHVWHFPNLAKFANIFQFLICTFPFQQLHCCPRYNVAESCCWVCDAAAAAAAAALKTNDVVTCMQSFFLCRTHARSLLIHSRSTSLRRLVGTHWFLALSCVSWQSGAYYTGNCGGIISSCVRVSARDEE